MKISPRVIAIMGSAVALLALLWTRVEAPRHSDRFRPDAWQLPNEPLLGFIHVDGGPFTMGSDRNRDHLASDEELPAHEVTLSPFFIGRYEVTVDQYKSCVEARACPLRDRRALEGPAELPVRYVSWHDALAYCGWLEQRLKEWSGTPPLLLDVLTGRANGTGWHVVLPSEAEWERAARGTGGRLYPWGDRFDPGKANYAGSGRAEPQPVGSFPSGASAVGALDMSGNVTEWTRSHSDRGYPYLPGDGRENLMAGDLPDRVTRGGSFSNTEIGVRAAARDGADTPAGFGFIGFRVAISRTTQVTSAAVRQ